MKQRWEALLHRLQGFLGGSGRGTGEDGHPTPELLSAYHDDRLSPETDGEIQEHFVDCEECPELMLDLDRLTTPAAVEAAKAEIPDSWVEAAWRRLRSRLAVEARPARPAPPRRWLRSPSLAWGLTAFLTPCTLFLGLRVHALGGELRDLQTPQLNPPSWHVDPTPVLRSADPPPPELSVPAGARQLILILSSVDAPADLEYGLKIRDGEGRDVWSERGLHKGDEGFVVTLSRRFLPAGLYSFQVISIAGEQPFEEEFPLRLTYL